MPRREVFVPATAPKRETSPPGWRGLLRPLWIALAILFLIEAWLWDNLEPLVAAVVNVVPWGPLKLRLARVVKTLPPWATLIVFAIPLLLLFPVKILELWLFAKKQWLAAIVVLILTKLVGLGITAFVFDVTRPKLLQMAWFRWLYDWVMALRVWAHELVAPVRRRARKWLKLLRPRRAGRLIRRLAFLRRRMQQA
jgi:hypothetical protein